MAKLSKIHPRRLYPIREAAYQIGVSRSGLYLLMNQGRIKSVTLGRRRFITAEAIDKLVADLIKEAA